MAALATEATESPSVEPAVVEAVSVEPVTTNFEGVDPSFILDFEKPPSYTKKVRFFLCRAGLKSRRWANLVGFIMSA